MGSLLFLKDIMESLFKNLTLALIHYYGIYDYVIGS